MIMVFFILGIMQVTFVIVDLSTASFSSQAMGMQAKVSNVMKHMPTEFQL